MEPPVKRKGSGDSNQQSPHPKAPKEETVQEARPALEEEEMRKWGALRCQWRLMKRKSTARDGTRFRTRKGKNNKYIKEEINGQWPA